MESWNFPDGNITQILESRRFDFRHDVKQKLQMHSSLVQRLALEKDIEGHQGCVNAITWNSNGTLLLSGSDDTRLNIWSYSDFGIVHSIDTGHSANIFCTKFVPETSDELVVSGAGDAEVRLFNLSRLRGTRSEESALEATAVFQCHSRRVKKLAVEAGNPHVIWSASEDGTLRQHDFREVGSCPPAGSSNQECRNVLLDLRSGAKKSLGSSPKQCLLLKSCDISSTRPHQIIVGGSDAFARLYDRRMLPQLSSCRTQLKPPPCVNYFCPIHLSEHRRSSLHLTHVAFSPNGEEVLLSYSGEHVYLMDLNFGDKSMMRYTADDVQKQMSLSPLSNESDLSSPESFLDQFSENKSCSRKEKLVQIAEKALTEGPILRGIEACNEILDGKGPQIGCALRHECLCIRAALLLKRKWKNDVYMAIRDCNGARNIYPSSFRAHYYMSEALLQLGKHSEALEYVMAAQSIDRLSSQDVERIQSLKERLIEAEAEKNKKGNGDLRKENVRHGRFRTLNDVVIRPEFNSEGSQEGHPYEEDSDYEGEVELDFESSISGDEDIESRILRGSLNLRFHRDDHSSRENSGANGSHGSPSSSQHEGSSYQPEVVIDMKQRYVGHCNVGTDIKQASFLGQQGTRLYILNTSMCDFLIWKMHVEGAIGHFGRDKNIFMMEDRFDWPSVKHDVALVVFHCRTYQSAKGEFVASGSDDGRWFIWEKRTGRLIKMLRGDDAVVNCVQCHPFDCAVATSGIDSTIKLWTPRAAVPSMVAGGTEGPETGDILSALESNQKKLCRNREAVLPFEFLERLRMHEYELSEGTLHPFECAQS